MYDRHKVEEALEPLSLGFSIRQAAELVGASPSAVQARACGRLPHERGARIGATGARRKAAEMTGPKAGAGGLYDPPASGPLAGLTPDQVENLLLRAVLDDLKGGRLAPGFDVEQEQVRARREIEAGDRPAPALRHRFLEDLEELL